MLLAKSLLSTIEVLISKALIDSNINQDNFFYSNWCVKKYNDMKKAIKEFAADNTQMRLI